MCVICNYQFNQKYWKLYGDVDAEKVTEITCSSLTSIPSVFGNLTFLNCSGSSLAVIPDTLIHLKTLWCSECPNIRFIPDTLVNLTSLSCHTTMIDTIPDILVNLTYLTCHTTMIDTIPDNLVNLISLECHDCKNISSIPSTFVQLEHLTCSNTLVYLIPDNLVKLKILMCSVRTIPTTLVHLQTLIICGGKDITEIPDTLESLVRLLCKKCHSLKVIPDKLVNLDHLILIDCPNVEMIPRVIMTRMLLRDQLGVCGDIFSSLSVFGPLKNNWCIHYPNTIYDYSLIPTYLKHIIGNLFL
jgi:Leucine-rich repeat (LRR) protein